MRQPRATRASGPPPPRPRAASGRSAGARARSRARAPHDVERLRPQAVARERDGVALGRRSAASPAGSRRATPRARAPRRRAAPASSSRELVGQIRREGRTRRAPRARTTEDGVPQAVSAGGSPIGARRPSAREASTASAAAAASCAPRRRPGTRGTRPRAGGGAPAPARAARRRRARTRTRRAPHAKTRPVAASSRRSAAPPSRRRAA